MSLFSCDSFAFDMDRLIAVGLAPTGEYIAYFSGENNTIMMFLSKKDFDFIIDIARKLA